MTAQEIIEAVAWRRMDIMDGMRAVYALIEVERRAALEEATQRVLRYKKEDDWERTWESVAADIRALGEDKP